MLKIYAAYGLKMVWDVCLMLFILYGTAWIILGPDISRIVNGIGKEIIRGYFG